MPRLIESLSMIIKWLQSGFVEDSVVVLSLMNANYMLSFVTFESTSTKVG